jgi:hypothetical protein
MTTDLETKENVAVVVTSISRPNDQLRALARGCQEMGYQLIVVGDEASPIDFHLEGCRFYSLKEQFETEFSLARLCPTRHYARKNLGYLIAIRDGAKVLIETDDDNHPHDEFWGIRARNQSVAMLSNNGWVNVYRYFSEANIWPRGLPLNHIKDQLPPFESLRVQSVNCPIQQGLVNNNPDVDAIYRLVSTLPQSFRKDRRIALTFGSWCPFNSQNTTWWRDVFPLLYLPAYCSFRMTDIWRGFVAQRIAWAYRFGVLFHEPNVSQQRNEHDLMRDFRDETAGYLQNEDICEALSNLSLDSEPAKMKDNLYDCYQTLVCNGWLCAEEMKLVEAWLNDLEKLSTADRAFPSAAQNG